MSPPVGGQQRRLHPYSGTSAVLFNEQRDRIPLNVPHGRALKPVKLQQTETLSFRTISRRSNSHSNDLHRLRASHSITSSASAGSVGGMSRPSALAAFGVRTRSNLAERMIGRSAGFYTFLGSVAGGE